MYVLCMGRMCICILSFSCSIFLSRSFSLCFSACIHLLRFLRNMNRIHVCYKCCYGHRTCFQCDFGANKNRSVQYGCCWYPVAFACSLCRDFFVCVRSSLVDSIQIHNSIALLCVYIAYSTHTWRDSLALYMLSLHSPLSYSYLRLCYTRNMSCKSTYLATIANRECDITQI